MVLLWVLLILSRIILSVVRAVLVDVNVRAADLGICDCEFSISVFFLFGIWGVEALVRFIWWKMLLLCFSFFLIRLVEADVHLHCMWNSMWGVGKDFKVLSPQRFFIFLNGTLGKKEMGCGGNQRISMQEGSLYILVFWCFFLYSQHFNYVNQDFLFSMLLGWELNFMLSWCKYVRDLRRGML